MALLDPLFDLLAPARCAVCGRRQSSMDPPFCAGCAAGVEPCRPECATCCARGAGPGSRRPCPLAPGPVDRVHAPWWWSGTIAATVRAGKLDGVYSVLAPLGAMLGRDPAVRGLPVQLVVPVPTSPRRVRRRGFDHAALLARGVAGVLGVPHRPCLRVAGRAPDRGSARGADGLVDMAWVANAAVRATNRVPSRVLLVDDVVTTGTTVVAAAAALRRAGASRVDVAAVARAGRH